MRVRASKSQSTVLCFAYAFASFAALALSLGLRSLCAPAAFRLNLALTEIADHYKWGFVC